MKYIYSIIILGLMMSMNIFSQSAGLENNPFFKPYNTPFDVPPFDKIKNRTFHACFQRSNQIT